MSVVVPKIKVKPDYQTGKIYRIINKNNDKYYIGSTILDLEKRFKQHVNSKKRYDKLIGLGKEPKKLASYDLVEGGSIELIEAYPCKSRRELQKYEGGLIRNHKEQITNYFVAGVSMHDFFKAFGILKKLKKL